MKKRGYACSECGYESTGWLGRCPSCEEFNTFMEAAVPHKGQEVTAKRELFPITQLTEQSEEAFSIPFPEVLRVLGGGIVRGQVILLGGEPGIGKSTLLLQMAHALAVTGKRVIYASGEESPQQIRKRAERLKALSHTLYVIGLRRLQDFLEIPFADVALVIVDSLQTLVDEALPQPAGSIAQVRACAEQLQERAKEFGVAHLLVSHVTKEGGLAGPKLVEHIVDTVLYLEGDRRAEYRILRGVKNRFGSTNELAILEMTKEGLREVKNPSSYFLSPDREAIGSCIVPVLEGQNVLLLEFQALVTPSPLQMPRRNSQGLHERRLSQIVAVLEKKAKLRLFQRDLFLNCVGGIRVDDTGADFGVALSIASSFLERAIPQGVVAVGEIGLAGEVRKVPKQEKRLLEAERLGFTEAWVPSQAQYRGKMRIVKYRYLAEAVSALKGL